MEDTGHISMVSKILEHPSYQQIVELGEEAIPLILEAYKEGGPRWAMVLHQITGIVPDNLTKEDASITQKARDAWLEWGIKNGYIESKEIDN